jgi:hypothetical protein
MNVFSTIISPQALGKIIPGTCEIIYKVLVKDSYKPNTRLGFIYN